MNELISVIVPIYNVEEYLSKCVDSIINQTYKNLEIILIDDGSTDKSSIICDNYQLTDSRVVVVHKENGGLSSARNYGIEISNGDLIGFVDSDDYLEPTFYEELRKNMQYYNSDISVCNYFIDKNNIKKVELKDVEDFCISKKTKFEYLENIYRVMTIFAWNKLYKRSIFKSIRFPEGINFEDAYIICEVLDNAEKVSYITKALYNYTYREKSISHSFNLKSFDKVKAFSKIIHFLEMKGYNDLAIKEKNRKVILIASLLSNMKRYDNYDKKIYDNYYNELKITNRSIKFSKHNIKTKLISLLGNNYIRLNSYKWVNKLKSKFQ